MQGKRPHNWRFDPDSKGCEYKICDFCTEYKDNGGGPVKRGGFAGKGVCLVDNVKVTADMSCRHPERFVCQLCKEEKERKNVQVK